jgi:hypothetical protein
MFVPDRRATILHADLDAFFASSSSATIPGCAGGQ